MKTNVIKFFSVQKWLALKDSISAVSQLSAKMKSSNGPILVICKYFFTGPVLKIEFASGLT